MTLTAAVEWAPCPVEGCSRRIPRGVLACRRCRALVPRYLRHDVAQGRTSATVAIACASVRLAKERACGA